LFLEGKIMGVPDEARFNPGFYKTWNSIVDSGLLALMKGSEVKVLQVILRHRNRDSRQSFPSIPRMMAEAGLCRESVQAAVKRLISYGLIGKHRFRMGMKFKCVYTVIDDPIVRLPNKPEKSAGKDGQIREKSGRFRKLSKNPTNANKPEKSAESNKPEKSALNKIEQDINYTEEAPLPSPGGGNASGPKPPEASFKAKIISDDTVQKIVEAKGRDYTLKVLRDGGYVVPPFLLIEGGSG
jgi:hypothetical protein